MKKGSKLARISANPANIALRKKLAKAKKKEKWTSKKADNEFSLFIRARDGKCVKCGKKGKLTNSHFWGRTNSATRYDPENCDALCWLPCHYTWEHQKNGDYMNFKIFQLGIKKYMLLEQRARSIVTRAQALKDCRLFLHDQ